MYAVVLDEYVQWSKNTKPCSGMHCCTDAAWPPDSPDKAYVCVFRFWTYWQEPNTLHSTPQPLRIIDCCLSLAKMTRKWQRICLLVIILSTSDFSINSPLLFANFHTHTAIRSARRAKFCISKLIYRIQCWIGRYDNILLKHFHDNWIIWRILKFLKVCRSSSQTNAGSQTAATIHGNNKNIYYSYIFIIFLIYAMSKISTKKHFHSFLLTNLLLCTHGIFAYMKSRQTIQEKTT